MNLLFIKDDMRDVGNSAQAKPITIILEDAINFAISTAESELNPETESYHRLNRVYRLSVQLTQTIQIIMDTWEALHGPVRTDIYTDKKPPRPDWSKQFKMRKDLNNNELSPVEENEDEAELESTVIHRQAEPESAELTNADLVRLGEYMEQIKTVFAMYSEVYSLDEVLKKMGKRRIDDEKLFQNLTEDVDNRQSVLIDETPQIRPNERTKYTYFLNLSYLIV